MGGGGGGTEPMREVRGRERGVRRSEARGKKRFGAMKNICAEKNTHVEMSLNACERYQCRGVSKSFNIVWELGHGA